MRNCDEGGCERCAKRKQYGSGKGYDECICVHAEQNALLAAARFGIPVAGCVIYTTTRPCFGCTKELLQAKVDAVYYLNDWGPKDELKAEYEKIQQRIPKGIRMVHMKDPDKKHAGGKTVSNTGHSMAKS
jgi:dCMP deaminase